MGCADFGRIDQALTITDALTQARTEHVIFFLLTAYAESLGWYDPRRSGVPGRVTRLPIAGRVDVVERLYVLRQVLEAHVRESEIRVLIEEAFEVFSAASRRLKFLQSAARQPVAAPGRISNEPLRPAR
jgi:hypothetical protein